MKRALAALILCACSPEIFECRSDDQCAHDGTLGRCELNGLCSFPDPACAPKPRRFGELSGDLTDQCVTGADARPDGQLVVAFGETGEATYANTTQDTWIDASAPTGSNAGSDMIRADAEPLRYGLLRFDISAIPGDAVVTGAQLRVWTTDDGALPAGITQVFRVRESWTEDAGWNLRGNGLSWTAAGVGPPSRDTDACAEFAPHDATREYVIDLPLDMVADWVGTPSSNAGVVLVNKDAGMDSVRLASRTNSSPGRRPLLVITYHPSE
jgi:hypothetical protein